MELIFFFQIPKYINTKIYHVIHNISSLINTETLEMKLFWGKDNFFKQCFYEKGLCDIEIGPWCIFY